MPRITLHVVEYGFLVTGEPDQEQFVQTDFDFPGLATTFGWSTRKVRGKGRCKHNATDGTVDCTCGVTAGQFISAAYDWLRDHDGKKVADPGYFDASE